MTARRSRVNATCNDLVKEYDNRPIAKRKSKEQWVLEVVIRTVGSRAHKDFVAVDDAVSDIILQLLDAGGFSWDEDEIVHFCRSKSLYLVARYNCRRERAECEFIGPNGQPVPVLELHRLQPARQEICAEASFALERLSRIPNKQRQAIGILCDGGNPVDVAKEMGVDPWVAITLIKEGRDYVDRV